MDQAILIIIVVAAGIFVFGHLKKTMTKGDQEDNCQDCTLNELLKPDQKKKKTFPVNNR